MIVVADTSPLNYLILIDCVHVLEPMYGKVAIPEAVRAEMLRPQAPAAVSLWANRPPEWVEVHSSAPPAKFFARNLDLGESQAISLALALNAPVIIIDEIVGRKEAQAHGLRVIGTLGILRDAHALGLLDLGACHTSLVPQSRLNETSTFRPNSRCQPPTPSKTPPTIAISIP